MRRPCPYRCGVRGNDFVMSNDVVIFEGMTGSFAIDPVHEKHGRDSNMKKMRLWKMAGCLVRLLRDQLFQRCVCLVWCPGLRWFIQAEFNRRLILVRPVFMVGCEPTVHGSLPHAPDTQQQVPGNEASGTNPLLKAGTEVLVTYYTCCWSQAAGYYG